MLLHLWEKGQLQIPLRTTPSLSYHGRYSTPVVPQLNIDGTTGSRSRGLVPWQKLNVQQSLNPPTSTSSSDSMMDDNLARYLNQGRRHTLGTAHHMILIPQEDMNRLRKINESSSSQASSGFGSSNTNALIPQDHYIPPLANVDEGKASVGSLSSSKQYLQMPHRGSRRRASDGGHYLEAYRNFLQKRNPGMYVHVDGSNGQQAATAKQLLQEKIETDRLYGRVPPLNRLMQNHTHHLLSSNGIDTHTSSHLQQLTSSTAPLQLPTDLRQQYQPFHDITQQQIREALEKLHMNDHNRIPSTDNTSIPASSSGIISNNDSSSSIDSKSSTISNSMLAQLLAATPSTTAVGTAPVMSHSLPTHSAYMDPPNGMITAHDNNSRRYSVQVSAPSYNQYRPHRNTLPELNPHSFVLVEGNICSAYDTSSLTSQDIIDSSSCSPESSLGIQILGAGGSNETSPTGSPTSIGGILSGALKDERRRRVGVTINSFEATSELIDASQSHNMVGRAQQLLVEGSNNQQGSIMGVPPHPPSIIVTEDATLQPVQKIPVYFNQHVSLLHPSMANQVAQQHLSSLVLLVSNVLNRFKINFQCINNIFTISHGGVDFQIHVQVSPHYSIQNALQLSLQYMHISGDPQFYQRLCTELAPHFVPNVQ